MAMKTNSAQTAGVSIRNRLRRLASAASRLASAATKTASAATRTAPAICLAAAACCLAPQRAAAEDVVSMSSQLANHMMSVQPTIQGGRITAAPRYANRNMSTSSQADERKEELRLDTLNGTVTVGYKLTTKTFAVELNLSQGRNLRIRKVPQNDSGVQIVEIQQPRDGAIVVTGAPPAPGADAKAGAEAKSGESAEPRKFESIWHLFVMEPEFAKKEAEPLLGLLRPAWQLSIAAKEVEEQMLLHAVGTRGFDRRHWSETVAKLGSDSFVDREAADRSLRELGRIIVPYLKNLDTSRLDAEQLHRVRAILRRYSGEDVEDSPATVADWLAGDPDIWVTLAARSTPSQRTTIRAQLSGLLGEAVVLDDTTDPAGLAEQVAAIRLQVERYRARQ
jgi:hypothetical protein